MNKKEYPRCPGDTQNHWDEWGRCELCDSTYHCSQCGGGCGMYAHYAGEGKPFYCQEEV